MSRLKTYLPVWAVVAALAIGTSAFAEDAPKKLKGLLITGGCCHDYPHQVKIITEGLSQRLNIEWDVVLTGSGKDIKVPVYENHDWIKPYDVVVHNECYGDVKDVKFVEGIVKAHTETGVPAVVIHCSMHSYRHADTDEWRKLLGVTSRSHESHHPIDVVNLQPDHPIMAGFPELWKRPVAELYKIEKQWPEMKPLAQAYGKDTDKNHSVIWTNQFGKAKVFGTTLGHHNETMLTDEWLGVVSRGTLWTLDLLNDDGTPKDGYAGTGIAKIDLTKPNPDAGKSPKPAK